LHSLVVGSDGNLWFVEQSVSRVGRMTTAGVVTEFSTANLRPENLSSGPGNSLWFTTNEQATLGRITTSGAVSTISAPGINSAAHIGVGLGGNVWLAGPGVIAWVPPSGTVPTEYFVSIPVGAVAAGDILAGLDGNVWFTEYHANKIGRFTPP